MPIVNSLYLSVYDDALKYLSIFYHKSPLLNTEIVDFVKFLNLFGKNVTLLSYLL